MAVAMALEAGEAAALQFEITYVEVDRLAACAEQDLARGSAEFTTPVCRYFVWFQDNILPSEVTEEAAQHVGRP